MSFDTVLPNVPVCHQLIVLGNGYDLECGLQSRFADFFKPRLEKVEQVFKMAQHGHENAFIGTDLTMWDFILKFQDHENWCDVENHIRQWVVPSVEGSEYSEYVKIFMRKAAGVWGYLAPRYQLFPLDFNEDALYDCLWVMLWLRKGEDAATTDGESFLKLLKDELSQLEALFAKYLQGEVSKNKDYLLKRDHFLKRLYGDSMPVPGARKAETSVLTFNYTDPFSGLVFKLDEGSVVNIHGRLGGDIIFGIDGQECMGNERALPFTKTYRIALADTRVSTKLFYDCHDEADGVTEIIKFYGHSLGEADYSYFQSIFDGVDLYGGRTKLVFYYRQAVIKGRLQTEEEARTSMVTKAAKLLGVYGKTFDNKDHGKNLMHRLMLEGRLTVKRI